MMKVGIDLSPLEKGHRVRGVGTYTRNLFTWLKKIGSESELTVEELTPQSKYDLIHYPYFDLFFISLPWQQQTKTVVTIHDVIPLLFPKHYPPGLKGQIKFLIQKILLKQTKAVITDSLTSKKDIIKFLGYRAEKIYPIRLGVEEIFKPIKEIKQLANISKKYRLPEKFVLYVGDINYNKNIPNLVRACEKAAVPLVIVGKQAVEKNIDRNHPENKDLVWLQNYPFDFSSTSLTASAQGKPLLILTGFVPQEDLPIIYNLASVYCQPSFYEGFGLPVLEAMACNCPVICSNIPVLKEICNDAVMYFDPHNVNDIAQKIKDICFNDLNHENKKRLRLNGAKQIKKYSWEKCAKETLEVYLKVARSG